MENLNWSELGFGYIKTDYNVRCYYRDGKWGELEVSSSIFTWPLLACITDKSLSRV